MPYDILGFASIDKYTARCRPCYFFCSPDKKKELEIERGNKYIKESENIN